MLNAHSYFLPGGRFYLGQKPIVVISDLDMLKEVTVKQFDNFHDRPPAPDLLRKKSGTPRGLFNARGDYWKKIRVTVTPTFSSAKMKQVRTVHIVVLMRNVPSVLYTNA